MLDVREKSILRRKLRLACARGTASRGMTLIELLVVIAILTTLVGGVIPVLSPNNVPKKIREASRGLQTYITLAQAKAASTGRQHGISIQETSAGSGVALEVFQMMVPPAYTGFSSTSRVQIQRVPGPNGFDAPTYGPVSADNPYGNEGVDFAPYYTGFPLYRLQFVFNSAGTVYDDAFPPRMFRIGDKIEVGGNIYMFVDKNPSNIYDFPNQVNQDSYQLRGIKYIEPDTRNLSPPVPDSYHCILLNDRGQILPNTTTVKQHHYKIQRQPIRSAEAPYQLPTAVAIDMQGSVVEADNLAGIPATSGFPIFNSFDDSRPIATVPDTVTIMFSSTGAVSSIYHNGNEVRNASRIMLLLGRIENGNLAYDAGNLDDISFSGINGGAWIPAANTKKALEDKQETVNWMNLDSRWLAIATKSGRAVVSENAYVNALNFLAEDPWMQAIEQIEASHEFGHDMRQGGGR